MSAPPVILIVREREKRDGIFDCHHDGRYLLRAVARSSTAPASSWRKALIPSAGRHASCRSEDDALSAVSLVGGWRPRWQRCRFSDRQGPAVPARAFAVAAGTDLIGLLMVRFQGRFRAATSLPGNAHERQRHVLPEWQRQRHG